LVWVSNIRRGQVFLGSLSNAIEKNSLVTQGGGNRGFGVRRTEIVRSQLGQE